MTEKQPPYLQAAGAAASAFLLYVLTLAPTTWFWDTSEYIATAHILGIPHPPGNPLFVVVGKVWELLLAPTGLSVAVRINLMAAVTSAVATGFFFLVAHRVLQGWLDPEPSRTGTAAGPVASRKAAKGGKGRRARESGRRSAAGDVAAGEGRAGDSAGDDSSGNVLRGRIPLFGAWLGALLGATAFTVWNQSNVNEKVYTLSVLVIAAVSWLAIRWLDRKDEPGSGALLVLALYLMVLGSTNHLMSMLPGPALLALVLLEKPRVFLDRSLLVRGGMAVVIGLSFNFFLPIRSAQQPIINEGEPICQSLGGAAVAVYTLGAAGCEELAANLTREQYGKPSMFVDPTTANTANPRPRGPGLFAHQLLNYYQYFDWQWGRGLSRSELPGGARLPFSLLFLGLGLWGIAMARESRRGHLVYLGLLAATLTVGLVVYLNFRYGFSLAPDHIDRTMREVRERDYFFIGGFHLWGFLAGIGLVGAWRWVAGGALELRALRLASPVLLVALVPLVFNWAWASRAGDYSARDWAWNLLQSVEPYGILFTNGDNDTFPLWYLQEVEGVRQDVTVIVGQYLLTQWYPRQLRYHTSPERQRHFTDPDGIGVYEAPETPPTRAITTLTDAELNGIAFAELNQELDVTLRSPEGAVVLQYPPGYFLSRGNQIALAIIQESLPERPIHFASTGGLAVELGLDRWVVRQGLTSRLLMQDLEEMPGVVQISEGAGGDRVDLERSLLLATEVFRYGGLRERDIWADRATLNIPLHFYFLHVQMADAAIQSGRDEQLVDELLEEAEQFLVTAQGGARGAP
jgi:hypothetical protein